MATGPVAMAASVILNVKELESRVGQQAVKIMKQKHLAFLQNCKLFRYRFNGYLEIGKPVFSRKQRRFVVSQK